MSRKILMLAWWFFTLYGGGRTLGPFETREACEQIRQQMDRRWETLPCWQGSR